MKIKIDRRVVAANAAAKFLHQFETSHQGDTTMTNTSDSLDTPTEGQREALRFAWMLCTEGLNQKQFSALAIEDRVALAESSAGLTVDELAKALRFLGAYYLAKSEALEKYAGARRRN